MASLWCIQIASMTLALWGHYGVKQGLPEHKHCSVTTVNLVSKRAPQGTSTTCPGLRGDSPPGQDRAGSRLITLSVRTACNFTLTIVSFWNFPCNIFRLWLTTGQWNHRSEAVDKGAYLYASFGPQRCNQSPLRSSQEVLWFYPSILTEELLPPQLQTLTFNADLQHHLQPPALSNHKAKQPRGKAATGQSSQAPQGNPVYHSEPQQKNPRPRSCFVQAYI